MLKKLGLGLGVALVLLLVAVLTRPATYTVTRQLQMNAPPDVVFAHVIDLHEWAEWSPWDKLDPNMKKSYSGPATGVGAKYEWAGNPDNVGTGSMTIAEVRPNEFIGITLEFKVPFESTSRTELAFAPASGGTNVTWVMKGTNDFMGKAFSLVMDMDKMIGADFDKGLATLKTHAEEHAKKVADEKAAAEKAAAEKAAQDAAAVDGGAPAP